MNEVELESAKLQQPTNVFVCEWYDMSIAIL